MNKVLYEGNIGNYSFIMTSEDVIDVWSDVSNERPDSFIFIKEGCVKTQKDFDMEISYWFLKNVG